MNRQEIIVKGMSCNHCVMAVKKALSSLQGVRAVDVDLASGRVVIESESAIDPSLLKNAVAGAGYEAL